MRSASVSLKLTSNQTNLFYSLGVGGFLTLLKLWCYTVYLTLLAVRFECLVVNSALVPLAVFCCWAVSICFIMFNVFHCKPSENLFYEC